MTFVRLSAAIWLVLGVACTVDNPLYTPLGDSGIPGTATDLAGRDLSGGGPTTADLSRTGDACTTRTCSSVGSESCDNGQAVPDRTCPEASSCAGGYCQPPALSMGLPGRSCDVGGPTESLCLTDKNTTASCQPFVSASNDLVTWRCAHAVGAGAVGTMCTKGTECRSGFCGSNGTCFRPCLSTNDCPSSGQGKRVCETVTITVEGKTISAKSCIPL